MTSCTGRYVDDHQGDIDWLTRPKNYSYDR